MKPKKQIKIYTDFDGTITLKDIGDEIFKVFGQFEPYNSRLKKGEITIHDYWQAVCRTIPPAVSENDITNYALSADTDAYFTDFVSWCRTQNYSITVLSDGFDVYIRPILHKLGLEDIEYYCNKLIFTDHSNPKPIFTYADESCSCLSASCKRNNLLRNSGEEDIIVFIGDGYSDFCAAEHADIIFAKKNLAAYCNENRLPHYPYNSFFDVKRLMKIAADKNRLKPRHQARLQRAKAYETE